MKYFHSLILTGLMIHLLPLNAENHLEENALPSAASGLIANKEEAPMTVLDEELSLLDEEFEEFKEELSSIEEIIQKKEHAAPSVAAVEPVQSQTALVEQLAAEPEEVIAAETIAPAAQALTENNLVSDNALDAETDVALTAVMNEATNAETPHVQAVLNEEELEKDAPATLNVQGASMIGEIAPLDNDAISVDLKQAFAGSPVIYSLLFAMSVFSVCIWLYSILSIRSSAKVSNILLKNVQNKLNSNNFDEALSICEENANLFCKMVSTGIQTRRHGLPMMVEAMKAEGKRSTISFWQKIGMLNDVAIIAPMIGLLGTVLGMFYAFYDVNRSIESISTLFDGLGISVGTTVAGLFVAILALILHSTAKYRLVRALAVVENEAQSIATQIDDRTSIYKG